MSDEAIEMINAIAEVPEGATVLVNGKACKGSRCADGSLHTGHQLAGAHPCLCKKTVKKTKKKGAK